MKKLIMLMLSTMWAASQLFAQNPYWAFSPSYVDFKTGSVKTLGAGTVTKYKMGNAIFSQVGNLLLNASGSSTNSRIIYKSPTDANSSILSSDIMGDFSIVPLPGQCQTYLVPTFSFCTCNTCGGSYPSTFFSSLAKVSFSDNSGHLCNTSAGSTYNRSFSYSLGMAAPPSPDISGSSPKPYLYTVAVVPVTNSSTCSYTSNNLVLNIYYGQSGSANNWTSFVLGNTPTGAIYIGEVDLSFDGTKLAYTRVGSNVIYLINNVNACVGGGCSSSSVTSITVSSATAVNGIEFSPDGSKLFYTKSTSSPSANQIGYVDLGTMAQSDVASSVGLGSSYLEYAIDGYMYVSDGSNLKGFNMTAPFTVSKTISGVPNSSQYNGVYTLPDQIDGFNYDNYGGGCQTGSVTYTSNPFKDHTQVNGTITASGSASVNSGSNVLYASNTSVLLQPNFSALSGSNFVAKIAPCSLTCAANGCTSSSFRIEEQETLIEDAPSTIEEVHIHPNPINSGSLHFGKTVGTYSMTNSAGALVIQGKNADRLDVTGLPKGLYLLKLDDKVEKVIVE